MDFENSKFCWKLFPNQAELPGIELLDHHWLPAHVMRHAHDLYMTGEDHQYGHGVAVLLSDHPGGLREGWTHIKSCTSLCKPGHPIGLVVVKQLFDYMD